ncbi:MAG: hypothetical protein R3C12_15990 [Planctomycetaceae bacterium]
MHLLLTKEAQQMGLAVSREQVKAHIDQATSNKLSGRAFAQIVSRMGVSGDELFSLMGEQLQARQARQILMPASLVTPEDYWDAYRKLNVRQEMALVPLAVEAFNSLVGDPSDQELQQLFEEYKDKYPNQSKPGAPGFRQPGRIKLGYLEIDYDSIEKTIPEITDEEIAAYYESNKEQYRNNITPEFPHSMPPGSGVTPVPEGGTPGPDLKLPMIPTQEEKPATEKTGEQPAGEKPQAEKPEADKPQTSPEKPSEPAPSGDTPTPTPAPKPETESQPQQQSLLRAHPFGNAFASVSEEPKPEEPKPEEPKPEEPKPEEPKPEEPKPEEPKPEEPKPEEPKPEEPKPEEPKPEEPKPEEPKPEEPKPEEPKPEEPKPDQPKPDQPKPDQPKPEGEPVDTPKPPAEPLPEFKPLDELLKGQIRAQLRDQRTRARMSELAQKARGEMIKINAQFAEAKKEEVEQVREKMRQETKELAANYGLRYVETPFLSPEELEESEDHPIGSATEPVANPFERTTAPTVVEQHFAVADFDTLARQRYRLMEAEDPSTLNRFVHWQIDFLKPHVPTWTEEGVQEQVRQAWIMLRARELAEQRAEEIAKLLRESDKTWAEALEGVTETGKEGSQSLVAVYTGEFSWLTQSSAPQTNPFAPPPMEITQIPIVLGGTSQEFMKRVFNEMENGAIGPVWSGDHRYIFVARVDNRTNLEQTQTDFLGPNTNLFSFFSPYEAIARAGGQSVAQQWTENLIERYQVKWQDAEE